MTTDVQTHGQVVTVRTVAATIHPFRNGSTAPKSTRRDDTAPEQAAEMAGHAMGTVLQLPSARPMQQVANALASSTELSQVIDTFLKIRDPDQRRYCLAVVQSCAMKDEGQR